MNDEEEHIWVFLTTEGYTEDNEGRWVENCQLLGVESGRTIGEAFRKVKEMWEGYAFDEAYAYQLMKDSDGKKMARYGLILNGNDDSIRN